MKFWILALLMIILGKPAYAQEALTLKECYQLALKRSETIAINQQLIKETEGQFWQSLSGVLPQINYEIAHGWEDRESNNNRGTRYRRFTFSQPLFSGFKEFAAISGTNAQHRQREKQLERAKHLLFIDVSNAFYFFQSYQEDWQSLGDVHKALSDTGQELKRRQDLGRSRESEVASAEASLYRAEAEQEEVKGQLEIARQLLEFLIGRPVDTIKDEDFPVDTLPEMKEFTAKADQRPDVQAARETLTVAQKNVTIARAGFWPTVSLDGNSYDSRTSSSSNSNTNVDWDITLNVSVPLFNGTRTIGDVKLAQAQKKQAELILIQTKRAAVLDIQNTYTRFITDQKKQLAFKKSSDASEKNYKLQQQDYSHSLVNNLEVLQALQDWKETRRDYIVTRNEAKRFYWNLKAAVGEIGYDAF